MKAGPVVATRTLFFLAASTQRWNTFVTPTFVASGPEGIYQGKRMILQSGLWARTYFTNAATASGNPGGSG
jgi:hypothetical protein